MNDDVDALLIAEDLADVESLLVYADQLGARGDAWGDLINTAVRAERRQLHELDASETARLHPLVIASTVRHRDRLLGAAAAAHFRDACYLEGSSGRSIGLYWFRGFVARIACTVPAIYRPGAEHPQIGGVMGHLLEAPAVQLLDKLTVTGEDTHGRVNNAPFDDFEVIVRHLLARPRRALKSLELVAPSSVSLGEGTIDGSMFPKLDILRLVGDATGLTIGELPTTRELWVEGTFNAERLGPMPRLTACELRVAAELRDPPATLARVELRSRATMGSLSRALFRLPSTVKTLRFWPGSVRREEALDFAEVIERRVERLAKLDTVILPVVGGEAWRQILACLRATNAKVHVA